MLKDNIAFAWLSFIFPGLGQLFQRRFGSAFLIWVLLLFWGTIAYMTSWLIVFSDEWFMRVLHFVIVIVILSPLYTIVILDAATYVKGQDSLLKKNILFLSVIALFFGVPSFICHFTTLSEDGVKVRGVACRNNMKQITLALLTYESGAGSFPPAYTVDEDGNPLHSWRVLILPYIEENALYKQIRLDEPWDSEYNSRFHDMMPSIYQCPSFRCPYDPKNTDAKDWNNCLCTYSVVVGENTFFPGPNRVSLSKMKNVDISDKIFLVERAWPVCWMDPNNEISVSLAEKGTNRVIGGIGSEHKDGANCATCDGSVRFYSNEDDLRGKFDRRNSKKQSERDTSATAEPTGNR